MSFGCGMQMQGAKPAALENPGNKLSRSIMIGAGKAKKDLQLREVGTVSTLGKLIAGHHLRGCVRPLFFARGAPLPLAAKHAGKRESDSLKGPTHDAALLVHCAFKHKL